MNVVFALPADCHRPFVPQDVDLDDVGIHNVEVFVNDLDDVLGLEEEFVVGIPTAQEISAVGFRCNQDLDSVGDPTLLANDMGAWMAPHGGHCNEDFVKAATLLN